MQYPTCKQQNKEKVTLQCLLYGIILVVANLVTRWKHSNAENIFYKETVADLRNHLYYLVMKSQRLQN